MEITHKATGSDCYGPKSGKFINVSTSSPWIAFLVYTKEGEGRNTQEITIILDIGRASWEEHK